jgi:hypothetical protein
MSDTRRTLGLGTPFFLPFALTLALIVGPASARAADQKLPHKVETGPSERMEFPENPPLAPALPVPGAPRSAPVVYGRHASIQVNVDANGANIPGDAANEPSLAVDPSHPLKMVIGWRQFDNVQSNFRQAGYAYTTDEGRTWTFPGVLTPGTFRSDPVLSADGEGGIGYLSLEESFNTDYFKSTSFGASWLPSVPAYGGDKEWLAHDRTGGIGRDNAYSFWTGSPIFTRSTNDGESFNPPSNVPLNPRWGTMDVGPDGVLHIFGVDSNYSGYVYSKSLDAQDPNDTSVSFNSMAVNLGGTVNYFTGPNPEGLLGQPWIAVDPSNGITGGYLYVVASVDPPGNDPVDIHFIRSTDHGQTWSTPVQINDDLGLTNWQWFGTMSVAPNGRIDVVWNDTRDTGQVNRSALYYSFSSNGGMTWSANERLSPIWDSFVGWPNQDKIGDYYQMTSDRVGANLAWAATFNNEEDVYYMRIGDYDCNGNGVGDSLDIANGASRDDNHDGIPDECEGFTGAVAESPGMAAPLSNSPNPFDPSTTIRFDMPAKGGRVRLEIYNVAGQLVRTLFNGEVHGGANSVVWDGTDDRGRRQAAGPYLYRLVGPGGQMTRRMLLLK